MLERIRDPRLIERPYKAEGGPFELGGRQRYLVISDRIYGIAGSVAGESSLIFIAAPLNVPVIQERLFERATASIDSLMDKSGEDPSEVSTMNFGVSNNPRRGRFYVGNDLIRCTFADRYGFEVEIEGVERVVVVRLGTEKPLFEQVRERLSISR